MKTQQRLEPVVLWLYLSIWGSVSFALSILCSGLVADDIGWKQVGHVAYFGLRELLLLLLVVLSLVGLSSAILIWLRNPKWLVGLALLNPLSTAGGWFVFEYLGWGKIVGAPFDFPLWTAVVYFCLFAALLLIYLLIRGIHAMGPSSIG